MPDIGATSSKVLQKWDADRRVSMHPTSSLAGQVGDEGADRIRQRRPIGVGVLDRPDAEPVEDEAHEVHGLGRRIASLGGALGEQRADADQERFVLQANAFGHFRIARGLGHHLQKQGGS